MLCERLCVTARAILLLLIHVVDSLSTCPIYSNHICQYMLIRMLLGSAGDCNSKKVLYVWYRPAFKDHSKSRIRPCQRALLPSGWALQGVRLALQASKTNASSQEARQNASRAAWFMLCLCTSEETTASLSQYYTGEETKIFKKHV